MRHCRAESSGRRQDQDGNVIRSITALSLESWLHPSPYQRHGPGKVLRYPTSLFFLLLPGPRHPTPNPF